jgi:hypothetical protein
MRLALLASAAFSLATPLSAQTIAVGAAAGVGITRWQSGPLARVTFSRSIHPGIALGLDLTYAASGAADTGSICDSAQCWPRAVTLTHVLQLSAPVFMWRSGPAPGVAAWLGPYAGRWLRCADPFYPQGSSDPRFGSYPSSCSARSALDLGIAVGAGVRATVGGRILGLSMRYARGFTSTVALGSSFSPTVLRPEVLGVMLTLETAHKAHLPN